MIYRSFRFPKKLRFQCLAGAFVIIFFLHGLTAKTQNQSEKGLPFITNYYAKNYQASPQNWAIIEDDRGVMYFGNSKSLLEYDGVKWRNITSGVNSIIRCFGKDKNGQIYYGSYSNFGYLTPDSLGQTQLHSLLKFVPATYRNFNDVWTVYATEQGIYFQSRERIFRFRKINAGTAEKWDVKVWNSPNTNKFMYAFYLDDTYYVHQQGVGLLKMVKDSLVIIPGSEFMGEERVQVMLPYTSPGGKDRESTEKQYLLGAFYSGLYLYNGTTFTHFTTDTDSLIKNNTLYKGILLQDGSYALATAGKGVVIVSNQGKKIQQLNREVGLQDESVYAVYTDRKGTLWMALDNGISRVESASPFTQFTVQSGITTATIAINRFKGVLYVGTTNGLLRFNSNTAKFDQVKGIPTNQIFVLTPDSNTMLVSTDGLFYIRDDKTGIFKKSVAGDLLISALSIYKKNPDILFAGVAGGIAVFKKSSNKISEEKTSSSEWLFAGNIPGVFEDVWSFAEESDGTLWAGTQQSVLRLSDFMDNSGNATPAKCHIERFGSANGLSEGSIHVSSVNGKVFFVSDKSVYRFDETKRRFITDNTFGDMGFGNDPNQYVMTTDEKGRVWLNFGKETALAFPKEGGGYRVEKTPFLPIADRVIANIFPEKNGTIWFATTDGLIKYNENLKKDYDETFKTFLRNVIAGKQALTTIPSANQQTSLNYKQNTLRFEYAAPFFEQEEKTKYQTWLEGFEPDWSEWDNNTYKEYTNLPGGKYHFHVRAMNMYQKTGEEAVYTFIIQPPWYFTWWAYLLYALAAISIVYFLIRYRTKQLHEKHRELEKIVSERTAELSQRVEELAVINSVQGALVSALDMQAIYTLVGERIREVFDAQVVGIATFNHEAGTENFQYVIEKGERFYPNPRTLDKLRQQLIQTRQKILIKNAEEGFTWFGTDVVPGTKPLQSGVFVPLIIGDKITSYVSLQNVDKENAFSDSDVRLLETLANSMSVALENARLFDETQRLFEAEQQRAAQLSIINSVQEGLASKLDMQAIYDLVGDKIRDVFDAQGVSITYYDRSTNYLFQPYYLFQGKRIYEKGFELGKGLTSHIIQTGQPLLINEKAVERYKELGAVFASTESEDAAKSWLGVPLISGGKVTGVIKLENYEREFAYTESDVSLLQTLANSMSVALENARLFDETNRLLKETEQRTAELGVINSVQEGLAKELDMQGIYDLVGNKIRDLFDAQAVIIATFDHENGTEHFKYVIEDGKRFYLDPRPYDKLRQHLIQTRQKIVINKNYAEAYSRFGLKTLPGTKMTKSGVFFPLFIGDKVNSYISLQNMDRENAFSESDVRLLETLSNSMSVALENARLFDETNRLLKETEQRTAELAVINSVQEGLARELDMQAIYDLVGNRIRDLFDAQSVGIATFDHEAGTEHYKYVLEKGNRYYPAPRPFDKLRQHLIQTRQKILINNDFIEAYNKFGMKAVSGTELPKSLLFVPLIIGDKVSSYVTLQNIDKENAFSESDVRLLETLANSMSVALESARLFDETNRLLKETEQRTAELAVINSVQEGLVREMDMQGIYDLVGDRVQKLFSAQAVIIASFDLANKTEHFNYLFENGEKFKANPRPISDMRQMLIDRRHTLYIETEEKARVEYGITAIEDTKMPKSLLFVPLLSGNDIRGYVSLQNLDTEYAFSRSDVRLLETLANSMTVALENARLFDETNRLLKETEQRKAELAVINSVQEGLVRETDLEAIYDLMGNRLCELFDTQTVLIRTFDHETGTESWRYAIERGERLYSKPRPLIWANQELIKTKKYILINKNYLEIARSHGGAGVSKGLPPKSALFVPMIVGDVVRGSISLQNVETENAFSESDVRLLTTLANSMIVAVENARLFEETKLLLAETEKGKKNVELLSDIGKKITASLDFETIFYKLYEHINQLADATIFGVGIYHPEKHQIEYNFAIEKNKRYAPYTRDTTEKDQFPVWCIENRMPVFINDVSKEYIRYINTYEEKEILLEDGSVSENPLSLIYLPLIVKEQVLGIITIQSFQKNAYTEYHLNLLQNLATYTSIALDNASAYRQLNEREQEIGQRAAELSTVNSISQAMASQLNPDELIKLVGDQMRDLFKANIVYIAMLDSNSKIISFPYQSGDKLAPMKLGEGLTSRILQTGKPLLINKDVKDQTNKLGLQRIGVPAASYLGVPVPMGDEIVGVLSIQSTKEENRFNENDQRLLSTIAASVGVALRKAKLFEEVQHAKMEAETARKTAEKANEAKSAFLSTVSHELRTPLTSVLGFAKIIRKRLEEKVFPLTNRSDPKTTKTIQQVSENLTVVISEGERLTTLINDVLDLAKIEAGKMDWNFENVFIAEIAERAIAATSSLFDQKSLKLERHIENNLPEISGDRDKLIQVMINLISNAVKFTPEGSVMCDVCRKENEIIVAITDTGIGIAPEDHKAVFEQFKQVGGDTLTDKPKGTGLGLPICKEIVEHHGGRIWLESKPGKGSTFFFALPVIKTDAVKPLHLDELVRQLKEQMAHSRLNIKVKDTTILVVDDEDSIRSLLRQELGEVGYNIEEASNGKEALAKIRINRPDLIILDIMMPEMNGFDVAAILKNDPQTMDIPIIVLSIVQDKARGYRIGVDRYLTKPIDTPALFAEVDALLGQGKSRKKVMVVDEDAAAVKTLTDVLKAKGYAVVESDGKELVQKAISSQPDIIILNSVLSGKQEIVQSLRFEKGLENVLFLIYQ